MIRIIVAALLGIGVLAAPAQAYDFISVADSRSALRGGLGSDHDVSYARAVYDVGPFNGFIKNHRASDGTVTNMAAYWSGDGDGKQYAICFKTRKRSWMIEDWTTGFSCSW